MDMRRDLERHLHRPQPRAWPTAAPGARVEERDVDALTYVVVRPQIVGNLENWQTVYYSDLVRRPNRRAAIRHGINAEGHDDFLLAHLRGDTLAMISWQYEDRPDEHDERAAIAETFGWTDGGAA